MRPVLPACPYKRIGLKPDHGGPAIQYHQQPSSSSTRCWQGIGQKKGHLAHSSACWFPGTTCQCLCHLCFPNALQSLLVSWGFPCSIWPALWQGSVCTWDCFVANKQLHRISTSPCHLRLPSYFLSLSSNQNGLLKTIWLQMEQARCLQACCYPYTGTCYLRNFDSCDCGPGMSRSCIASDTLFYLLCFGHRSSSFPSNLFVLIFFDAFWNRVLESQVR